MKRRFKSKERVTGFTLLELVIVVAIIALIAVAVFVLLNPKKQLDKGWDGQRKHDLAILSKTLEDWYNDNNCYPQPGQICYNAASVTADSTLTCNICGKNSFSPSFTPYLTSKLPCDPEYSRKNYTYEVPQGTCPTWYKIYTKLGLDSDPQIADLGCESGCGPAPAYAFNYGVSSPNVGIQTNPAAPPTTTPTPPPGATATPTPTPTRTPTPTVPGAPTNTPTPTRTPTPTVTPGGPTATPTPTPISCPPMVFCKQDGECNIGSACVDPTRYADNQCTIVCN